MANNSNQKQESTGTAPSTPKQTMDLITADHMRVQVDRPTPWVIARLEELKAKPILKLDGVEYFEAETLDLLREVSLEWSERIRKAKLEAVAAGD